MSLDVYLTIPKEPENCVCLKCFNEHKGSSTEEVFSANITHNLGKMAIEAGIYQACWRPEEIGASKAKDIVPMLEKGLADLKARPEHFQQFNSPNGWGMYDNFVPWVEKYLDACRENLEAEIGVSR